MRKLLKNDWQSLLTSEFDSPYFLKLQEFLKEEYQKQTVYPDWQQIFSSFNSATYTDVKVVILGQDPYHGQGQAHGLSFSVQEGIRIPRSLQNINKELLADCGCATPAHGCLIDWAKQGVLLLNTILTVRQGEPKSHRKKGWETFTDHVIALLNEHPEPIVFLLWGNDARSKKALISNPQHLVLEASHPSPFSVAKGFHGCRHFSQANSFLISRGRSPIDWCL